MRLKRLKIGNDSLENGYKNFLNTTIDFHEENYSILIGLNGSGKSNLLEAISKIFKSFYFIDIYEKRVDFDFELEYSILINKNLHDVTIKFNSNSNRFNFSSSLDGKINQMNFKNYLPTQIIANYSGEELRLWKEVYFDFYDKYTAQIIRLEPLQNMNMIYLNKYNWTIALISLLCLEDEIIMNMLNLDNINNIDVKFEFDTSKYPSYRENKVIELIDYINPDRREAENMDLISIKSSDTLNEEGIDEINKYINLFNYLYVASMPKENKIIKSIDVSFGDYGVKSLSEGEKKMILIRFIYYFSKNKESLILLDEPDSHIHISRKKDLSDMIKEDNSFYSVITTHSPVLVNHFDEENISILIPDDVDGIKVEKAERFKQIELLADDVISLLDTSLIVSTKKHILLCEGTNDLNYIKKH
jgi:predicted ATP-dependent endonuclease of OLD family